MNPLRTIREISEDRFYESLLAMAAEALHAPTIHPDQGAESHEWWDAERGCVRQEKVDG